MEKKPRILWEGESRLLRTRPQLPQEILGDVAVEFAKAVVINRIKVEGEQDAYAVALKAESHVEDFFDLVYAFLNELSSQNQESEPCISREWYTAILDMGNSIGNMPSE
jgi:hypothetical protein